MVRGGAWDIMSYSTAILGKEDVLEREGDGSYLREKKVDCWASCQEPSVRGHVKDEVTKSSLGLEGRPQRLDSRKTC